MKNLKAKLKKQGGFTLIEMLIVVAIIAILIAVSIPLVSNALEKARQATDAANERAAKAEITISYLNSTIDADSDFDATEVYAYDAVSGKLSSTDVPTKKYGQCDNHQGQYIIVKYNTSDATVTIAWTTSATVPDSITASNDLCMNEMLP